MVSVKLKDGLRRDPHLLRLADRHRLSLPTQTVNQTVETLRATSRITIREPWRRSTLRLYLTATTTLQLMESPE